MRFRRIMGLAILIATAVAAPGRAGAEETVLHGLYEISLAGLTIGQGGWNVQLGPHHFHVTGWGKTAGIVRLFWSGKGEASASGDMRDGAPEPRRYDYESTTRRKFDEIHLRLDGGTVTQWRADPPQKPGKNRVPIRDEDRVGVTDPVAALLMPVAGTGDPVGPGSCARVLRVFDGRIRYDLDLGFKRIDIVSRAPDPHAPDSHASGYQGPAVVCGVRFVPIAGHVPDRKAIRYLTQLETMEIALVPVAGTRLLVPWRVSIPTPFGTAKLEAERFEVERE